MTPDSGRMANKAFRKNVFGAETRFFLLLCLTCTVMSQPGCDPPKPVPNGYYTPQQIKYEYDSNVTYHCDYGYVLDEEVNTRSCAGILLINAYYWSGNDPACVPISCSVPQISNAIFNTPDSTQYKTTFTYHCNEGLVPLGQQTAECSADGTWNYEPCQTPEFTCDSSKIPIVAHATHNASASIQQPSGTIVRYTCSDGYSKVVAGDIKCVGTSWTGSLPSCQASSTSALPPAGEPPTDQGARNSSTKIELPIVAGVGTALILTTVLLITVYCLRRRKQSRYSQKADSMVSGTTNSSGPADIVITPNQSFRFPRRSSAYPGLQQHSIRSQTPAITSSMSVSSPPALPQSQPPQSALSARSGASSAENTASEAEFHTIRECLGDFRNNNNSPALVHNLSCPKLNYHHMQHPAHPYSRTVGPNNRPIWAHPHQIHHTCGRSTPYETVTCPHGVEHVYQHLEHVYEEPRIWSQPLPNPHNQ